MYLFLGSTSPLVEAEEDDCQPVATISKKKILQNINTRSDKSGIHVHLIFIFPQHDSG